MKKLLAILICVAQFLSMTGNAATCTNYISDGFGNPIPTRVIITPFTPSIVFGGTNVLGPSVAFNAPQGAWAARLLGGFYLVQQGLGQPNITIFAAPNDPQTNSLAFFAIAATNPIPSFFSSGQGLAITVSNFNANQFIFAWNTISIITGALVTNLFDYGDFNVAGTNNTDGTLTIYDPATNAVAGFDTNKGGWYGLAISTNLTYPLSTFAGPTNKITGNNTYWNYTATGNIAITNLDGITNGYATWATLNASNQTAGTITGYVTVPFARAIGSQTQPAMPIPSGKVGIWSFLSVGGLDTNYIAAVQDAVTDASLATNYVNQVSNALFLLIPGPTSQQYPWTNDPTAGIYPTIKTNPPVSGLSSIAFSFPGYANAVATGTNVIGLFLGNTNTSQFPFTALSYINTTNADGSILMDTVSGYNMNPGAGVILAGQPQLGQQLEYHWPQVGKGYVGERHDIFSPTNGVKQRYFDAQFVETNGYTGLALSFDYLAFSPHTNSTAPAIQMNMGWISSIPTITQVMYNGSFFYWPYPEGAGILAQAEDSTATAHSLWSWSPTCGGTGCLFVGPNGDFASVQQNVPFYLQNKPFGLAGNSGLSPSYIQVNGQVMTATGGITAGGTADPGAGVISATNRFVGNGQTITNIVLEDVVSPTNGVSSANAVDFSVREATTNIAGAVSFTSLSNFNQTNYNYAIRWIINRTGANQTITVGTWETDSGRTTATTYTSTNNTTLGLLFKTQINVFTNVMSVVTFR